MTDELVKRLRGDWCGYEVSLKAIDAMTEAADRIEALTAERDHAWAMVAKADTQVGQSLADHMQAKAERDRIEALNREVKDLKKLVFAAYCEGFNDGKDGGWIVGPTNQPWKASDAHRMLKTIEAKP